MALPLIPLAVGMIGFGGLSFIGLSVMSEVIYWGSALAGLIVFGKTLQVLITERMIEPVGKRLEDNILYTLFSGLLALIAFHLGQGVFVLFGATAAALVLALVLGAWVFGATTVVAFTANIGYLASDILRRE